MIDLTALGARTVLVATDEPARYRDTRALSPHDAARVQLTERVEAVVVDAASIGRLTAVEHRLLVHNAAANLQPGGQLLVTADAAEILYEHAIACGFEPAAPVGGCAVWRRGTRVTVHDRVAAARARFARLTPGELAAWIARDADLVVLDIRDGADRAATGVIGGSVHAPRTVLEWRVDPASGYTDPAVRSFEQPIVVVCNEGYSSSLAAAELLDLGFLRVTDLIGGVRAWQRAGLPTIAPREDHEREERCER
jgi:rhodanese-related sulfurtransferase